MKWNDGRERALYEREQTALRSQYLQLGMTKEQIHSMQSLDKAWYKNRRREARHTQDLYVEILDDNNDYESKNPLYKKFLRNCSIEDKYWDNDYDWIEEIGNEGLYFALKSLSESNRVVLNLLVYYGMNQRQVAEQLDVSQQAISKKIKKFRTIFSKWL